MPQIRADASGRIGRYIAAAAPFARPICKKLRRLIGKAEPGIIEDWKWGPNFNKDGMVCGIWAFSNHVTLTFFQGALLKDPKGILLHGTSNAQNRSVKFSSVDDIDERTIIAYVREAVRNNAQGLKAKPRVKSLTAPADLRRVLAKKPRAREFFETLAYTHRKEYILWISTAKRPETRARRVRQALAMLSNRQKTR